MRTKRIHDGFVNGRFLMYCIGFLSDITGTYGQNCATISDKEVFAARDDYRSIECRPDNQCAPRVKTVEWYDPRGQRITQNDNYAFLQATVPDDVIEIRKISERDDGEFKCVYVTNANQRIEHVIVHNVVDIPVIHSFKHEPAEFFFGEEVKIICNATGKPRVAFNFRRDGKVVGDGLVPGGVLTIADFREQDNGMYRCEALNRVKNNPGVFKTHSVVGKYVPEITLPDNTGVIKRNDGEYITLKCYALGSPEINITWHDSNGNQINDTVRELDLPDKNALPRREKVGSELGLVLNCSIHSGSLTCRAENARLREKNYVLDVSCSGLGVGVIVGIVLAAVTVCVGVFGVYKYRKVPKSPIDVPSVEGDEQEQGDRTAIESSSVAVSSKKGTVTTERDLSQRKRSSVGSSSVASSSAASDDAGSSFAS